MKIKKITITGMHKIGKKSYDLHDGVTYFIGENGAGKSTILEAIQLGLLGYIPGYAKTNEAIMKHASGPSMTVSLTLDDDIVINRTWVRSGSSVKSTVECVNCDAKTIGEIISDIELPIFNFNEFRSMTSNKLKEWFIAFLPSISDDLDLREELAKEARSRTLPYEDLLNELMQKADASSLKGVELVKSMNSWIKEDQSFIKGQISRLQGTIESLIHYDDAPVIDEEEVETRIKDLTFMMDQLARYESARTIYQRALEAVKDLEESLPSSSFASDSRIQEMEGKIKILQEEIGQLQGQFNALQSEKMSLSQKKGSIVNIGKDTCPYTKQHCDTIAKIAEDASKKAAEIDEKIKAVDAKIAKCDASIWRAKESEKQQLLSNIDFIRGQYSKLEAMKGQLADPGEAPTTMSVEEMRSEIDKLNKDLAMVRANKKFDELTDQVTKDKFARENDLEVLKIWEKTTGANGLQTTLMDKPFQNLAQEMSNYLTKMFGKVTTAQFNLSTKANSFSFGLTRDDAYIEFDYLSSGERCLFTLALIMCILNKSTSPVRTILIDDILDHLDEVNSSYLFDTLKTIDDIQFIMAGVKECKNKEMCREV